MHEIGYNKPNNRCSNLIIWNRIQVPYCKNKDYKRKPKNSQFPILISITCDDDDDEDLGLLGD